MMYRVTESDASVVPNRFRISCMPLALGQCIHVRCSQSSACMHASLSG